MDANTTIEVLMCITNAIQQFCLKMSISTFCVFLCRVSCSLGWTWMPSWSFCLDLPIAGILDECHHVQVKNKYLYPNHFSQLLNMHFYSLKKTKPSLHCPCGPPDSYLTEGVQRWTCYPKHTPDIRRSVWHLRFVGRFWLMLQFST